MVKEAACHPAPPQIRVARECTAAGLSHTGEIFLHLNDWIHLTFGEHAPLGLLGAGINFFLCSRIRHRLSFKLKHFKDVDFFHKSVGLC